MIRSATHADAEAICAIYNHYIAQTTATFETEPVTTAEMQQRISNTTTKYPWLVFEQDRRIIGFAYATAWRVRAAYRNSVESTVYLHHSHQGKGIGTIIYKELLSLLGKKDVHAVIGGIALPNAGSVALHEKLGFVPVAHFKEVGFKFEKWVDVGYWQKLL
jgi:L-amino acid N-acyltransferase YncA